MTRFSTSVALATFNGSVYLPAQLASIAAQDVPPDEVVVGDDQSNDTTEQIVQQFARDSGIAVRFQRNAQRLGSSANFAAILSRCQGEVIFLSDQDDVWQPDRIRTSLDCLQSHPEVGFVFSDAQLISDAGTRLAGRLWGRAFFDRQQQRSFREHRGWEVLLKTNTVTGATMAIRRQALACALPIPPGWVHDGWLAFMIELVHGAFPLEAPLISYRVHASQQIGVVGWSPSAIRGLLRRQDPVFYRREADNFRILAQRLRALDEKYRSVAEHAEAKAAFLERRALGRESLSGCLQSVGGALVRGSYSRYGMGAKQALFDLAGGFDAGLRRLVEPGPGRA